MDNSNQISGCVAPGAPFVTASLPQGMLAPGQTVQVTANFANYSPGGITYVPSVLQGSGMPLKSRTLHATSFGKTNFRAPSKTSFPIFRNLLSRLNSTHSPQNLT